MGEKVEPRKEFIMKYAKEVRNLDIWEVIVEIKVFGSLVAWGFLFW
jgi:hypothetical protein